MWQARITVKKNQQNLGFYDDESEAARAYDAAARKLRRETNFPEEEAMDEEEAGSDLEVTGVVSGGGAIAGTVTVVEDDTPASARDLVWNCKVSSFVPSRSLCATTRFLLTQPFAPLSRRVRLRTVPSRQIVRCA